MAEPTQIDFYREETPYGAPSCWLSSLTGTTVGYTGSPPATEVTRIKEIAIAFTSGMTFNSNGFLQITTPDTVITGNSFSKMGALFGLEKRDQDQVYYYGSYTFKPAVSLDADKSEVLKVEWRSGSGLAAVVPSGYELAFRMSSWHR